MKTNELWISVVLLVLAGGLAVGLILLQCSGCGDRNLVLLDEDSGPNKPTEEVMIGFEAGAGREWPPCPSFVCIPGGNMAPPGGWVCLCEDGGWMRGTGDANKGCGKWEYVSSESITEYSLGACQAGE